MILNDWRVLTDENHFIALTWSLLVFTVFAVGHPGCCCSLFEFDAHC